MSGMAARPEARGGLVQVVFLKYDGRPHRSYPARWLGEDSDGAWLGVTAGSPATVDGNRTTFREEPYVLLVPKRAWWTAMFNAPPRRTERIVVPCAAAQA